MSNICLLQEFSNYCNPMTTSGRCYHGKRPLFATVTRSPENSHWALCDRSTIKHCFDRPEDQPRNLRFSKWINRSGGRNPDDSEMGGELRG